MRHIFSRTDGQPRHRAKIIIVGCGFAGLAAAIRIKQSGERDFIILERATDLGGVWRDNIYPGCACDVESHLYSLSFAPNADWTHAFSMQPEIHTYLRQCAVQAELQAYIRFSTNVTRMSWDEAAGEWSIESDRGMYRARFVFAAFGSLSDPLIPKLERIERFQGQVFHSARWPHCLDLSGKSVAVIGTGASAVQFVPKIQPLVSRLHLFQRTAPWVMPRRDFAISARARQAYRSSPWLRRLERARLYLRHEALAFAFRHPTVMRIGQRRTIKHMHAAVRDPELRQKLTPDYTQGCKRILLSNDYYPALTRTNVKLVTAEAVSTTRSGVVGSDGLERAADVIIFGTGFRINDPSYAHFIFGKRGFSLAEIWDGRPNALAGTTVHGFPNLFLLNGPNVGLAHTSVLLMVEVQIKHALGMMRHAHRAGRAIIEAKAEAQVRFSSWIDRQIKGTVWASGGCRSWYLGDSAHSSVLWPSYTFTFRQRVALLGPADYELRDIRLMRAEASAAAVG